jgi:hypothetical protein
MDWLKDHGYLQNELSGAIPGEGMGTIRCLNDKLKFLTTLQKMFYEAPYTFTVIFAPVFCNCFN